MGRPYKEGLNFFPLDVDLKDEDDSVELLEAEHGLVGYAILIKLWQRIYKNGYFMKWNNDSAMLFAKYINTDVNMINEVINTCLLRNLFSKSMYEKHHILTSHGVQKRYITACNAAKRKQIFIKKDYLLVKEPDLLKLITEEIQLTPEESTQKRDEIEEIREEGKRAPAREEKPSRLYSEELARIGKEWEVCKLGLFSTSVMGVLLEFMQQGVSADVVIFGIREARDKPPKNAMSYIKAVLGDKLARKILTQEQLEADIAKQEASGKKGRKGATPQSGYGDTRSKAYV